MSVADTPLAMHITLMRLTQVCKPKANVILHFFAQSRIFLFHANRQFMTIHDDFALCAKRGKFSWTVVESECYFSMSA